MTEVTESKLMAAGGKLLMWRKIYNILCRSCKHKIFRAGAGVKKIGTAGVVDRMQKCIDDELCSVCKNRIDVITKRQRGD